MNGALSNLGVHVLSAVIYALLGIFLFIFGFFLFDRITPGLLWKELIEDQNVALGVLMGCVAIALAIIVAAAVV